MSQHIDFKQSGHLNAALYDPATKTLSIDSLTGRWVNTNRQTQGIAECSIAQEDDKFSVSGVAVGADDPIIWPATEARVFANLEEEAGQRALALAVTFDFGFWRADAYLRVNKGVLVIVLFNTFQDKTGRSNYVTREFFYRPE
jgi:hypothetical protein